mgnify:FL=1
MRLRQLDNIAKFDLTAVEKSGDPEAITTQLLNINSIQRDKRIRYPRASGIYKDCMRCYAIGNLYKAKAKEYIPFARQVTFDIGNAVHRWLQNSPDYYGEQRVGYWKCLSCNHITHFSRPRATPCDRCGANSSAFEYSETLLILKDPYNISGHPDLFLDTAHAKGKIRIVEFKTIDGDKFNSLRAPLVEHVWQVNAYMWMCHEDPVQIPAKIDTKVSYVVYISKKEKQGTLPIKTYLVKRNPEIITEIKQKLEIFNTAIKTKTLPPPYLECIKTGFNSWTSKFCPLKEKCKEIFAADCKKR